MLVAAVTPAALEPRADAGCRKTSVKGGFRAKILACRGSKSGKQGY